MAVLTPAASVVTLDVVSPQDESSTLALAAPAPNGGFAEYDALADKTSLVSAEPADAEVTEVQLTAPRNARIAPSALKATAETESDTGLSRVTSTPQPITGYGTVGVTWESGANLAEDAINVEARTLQDGEWSDWMAIEYEAEHGPDLGSSEDLASRPGTDPLLIGDVDEVQVQIVSTDAAPADLKLAVIEPGDEPVAELEQPAIDTAELDAQPAANETDAADAADEGDEGEIVLQSASAAPAKPKIYSRAQWGANESWRDKGSLRYGSINAGFVHHTVNANDYSADQVPALLRSIYAYHTKSLGWSDIGYNFLVDRFGRIWEGRAGGVWKAVVGAHTLGYNEYSFAMSAIGNFETTQPSNVMLEAYGSLFAWKLGRAGVDPSSTRQKVGRSYFQAINGHRDAGSTACPGKYLYAKLGKIRDLAAAGGSSTPPPAPEPTPEPTPEPPSATTFAGRILSSNLASSTNPDLVVRRASDGQGVIIPTGGLTDLGASKQDPTRWGNAEQVIATPDVTADGRSDVLVIRKNGKSMIRPGNGRRFVKARKTMGVFRGHELITAVGDLNTDGVNDFVGRNAKSGRLNLFMGGGKGGFARRPLMDGWQAYDKIVATGDVNGDNLPDVMGRDAEGRLWLHPGTGRRTLADRVLIPGSYGAFDTIIGFGDYTRNGQADLFLRRADTKAAYLIAGRGDGTFTAAMGPYLQFAEVRSITAGGSVAGNWLPDLIGRSGDRLQIFPSTGTYNLGGPVETNLNLKNADAVLNAGDFDKDGYGDVITRNASNGRLFLRRGDGRGSFSSVHSLGSGFASATELSVIGDLTRDGKPDLVIERGGKVYVYPGNGTGDLGPPIASSMRGTVSTAWSKGLDLRPYDWIVETSDLDGDKVPDLLVRERSTKVLYAIRRNGSGYYPRSFIGETMADYDLAG
ncbi:FG-GAP-like repeat-containing protein [Nocardioides salsibiostraticola]